MIPVVQSIPKLCLKTNIYDYFLGHWWHKQVKRATVVSRSWVSYNKEPLFCQLKYLVPIEQFINHPSNVYPPPSTIYYLHSSIHCLPSTVYHQTSAIKRLPSTVHPLPSIAYRHLLIINSPSSTLYNTPSTVYFPNIFHLLPTNHKWTCNTILKTIRSTFS